MEPLLSYLAMQTLHTLLVSYDLQEEFWRSCLVASKLIRLENIHIVDPIQSG